jgi:hypothetical protein
LSQKTCAEFNVDVAYFKATFPELETRKMATVNMTVGLLFLGFQSGTALERLKRVEAAAKTVVDACARQPDATYLKTFADLVKNASGS